MEPLIHIITPGSESCRGGRGAFGRSRGWRERGGGRGVEGDGFKAERVETRVEKRVVRRGR